VFAILRSGNMSMREDRYDEEEKQEAAPFQRKPPMVGVSHASIALTFWSLCKLERGPCSRKISLLPSLGDPRRPPYASAENKGGQYCTVIKIAQTAI
jgi:hypothetical protein